ncbi:thiamine pyrophosphate-binding protein [Sedimentitalea todarodis]|uniref:Thiamine pyrophosphate-binding protein n=1 Tax=Sedimentitalea todarodis TaxID=1631240 RepID=A0ABU3VDX5_9RHOB|nr:thiamine pyrophosphate-dependent enzyme [Sedimentitalea todarodis]MDU9004384.1 thiamine pyrophosphate-binding protein [Sedimentitalea todarodis]
MTANVARSKKKTAKVAALIAEMLEAYGVEYIFGMEDPVQLYHHLNRDRIRPITIRDEKHGAIMAHGYAKTARRPGICASTFGPGATNLSTGLLEAQKSSVPVIAFIQEIPAKDRDRHASSEIDHIVALAPFTKKVYRIDTAERCCEVVRRAFRMATSGRPGPVVVLCPADIMTQQTAALVFAEEAFARFPAYRTRPAADEVDAAARLLAAAERPVLIAGGGTILSGASDEMIALAERLGAPVATTMTGRGTIPDAHGLSVGALGSSTGGTLGRGRIANEAVANSDLVLIAGSRTGQICYMNWQQPGPDTKVIHLDIDPEEPGRNFRTDITLIGDVRETLRDLIAHPATDRPGAAVRQISAYARRKEDWHTEFRAAAFGNATPVRPERVLAEISSRMNADTIIVNDASYSSGWTFSHVDNVAIGADILSPRGTGGIGWSVPAALGAKLARPDSKVICITGDGAFGYVMAELETAARCAIPIVVVVLNNATLGFQRHFENKLFGSYGECDLTDIDHAKLAQALNCDGARVTDPEAFAAALEHGLKSERLYLIDVVIDDNAMAPIIGLDAPTDAAETH